MTDVNLYNSHTEDHDSIQLVRPDYRGALEYVIQQSQNFLQENPGSSLCDFCGGTGHISENITSTTNTVKRVEIIDINNNLLKIAQDRNVRADTFICTHADIRSTQILQKYNLVISAFAYHHIPDKDKDAYVKQVKRALLTGGQLLLAEIFFDDPNNIQNYYEYLLTSIPQEQQSAKLKSFLDETSRSTKFEFKVSKQYSDEQFKKHGFRLIQEKKIWPSNQSNEGTFVQIYTI